MLGWRMTLDGLVTHGVPSAQHGTLRASADLDDRRPPRGAEARLPRLGRARRDSIRPIRGADGDPVDYTNSPTHDPVTATARVNLRFGAIHRSPTAMAGTWRLHRARCATSCLTNESLSIPGQCVRRRVKCWPAVERPNARRRWRATARAALDPLAVAVICMAATVLAPSTTSVQVPSTVVTVSTSKVSRMRVSTAIRLPADLHTELQRQAEERDVSVNFLVTRAVDHYLRQLRPADPLAHASEPLE
jgi:hypothetical protein